MREGNPGCSRSRGLRLRAHTPGAWAKMACIRQKLELKLPQNLQNWRNGRQYWLFSQQPATPFALPRRSQPAYPVLASLPVSAGTGGSLYFVDSAETT